MNVHSNFLVFNECGEYPFLSYTAGPIPTKSIALLVYTNGACTSIFMFCPAPWVDLWLLHFLLLFVRGGGGGG